MAIATKMGIGLVFAIIELPWLLQYYASRVKGAASKNPLSKRWGMMFNSIQRAQPYLLSVA